MPNIIVFNDGSKKTNKTLLRSIKSKLGQRIEHTSADSLQWSYLLCGVFNELEILELYSWNEFYGILNWNENRKIADGIDSLAHEFAEKKN